MARNARRNYVRDGRGRFSSTPGGGPAKKARPARTSFRQRQAVSLARQRGQTGRLGSATREAKARLAASRKKLGTNASPQQKAAVTRAKRMAAMLAGERRIRTAPQAGVLRGAAGRGVKKGLKSRPQMVSTTPMSRPVPASQRPGSLTSTLRGTLRNLARTDAARIREVEAITGQKLSLSTAGAKAASETGARVRGTAKGGKVAATLRAGLRELAQSDARAVREMASIVRDATPKVAGAKGGKAIKGGRAALPGGKPAAAKQQPQKPSKKPANKAQRAYLAARSNARARGGDLRGADAGSRRMANSAAAVVKGMERRRSAAVPKAPADSPRTKQQQRQAARAQRAVRNQRAAMAREADGPGSKASRSASVARRAQQIYAGKVDPKVKTKARLTRTDNPEVLRKRITKIKDNTARAAAKAAAKAAKAAAKPKPAIRGKGRTRVARPAGTVAKPKGLKPGVLAARRGAKAGKLTGKGRAPGSRLVKPVKQADGSFDVNGRPAKTMQDAMRVLRQQRAQEKERALSAKRIDASKRVERADLRAVEKGTGKRAANAYARENAIYRLGQKEDQASKRADQVAAKGKALEAEYTRLTRKPASKANDKRIQEVRSQITRLRRSFDTLLKASKSYKQRGLAVRRPFPRIYK